MKKNQKLIDVVTEINRFYNTLNYHLDLKLERAKREYEQALFNVKTLNETYRELLNIAKPFTKKEEENSQLREQYDTLRVYNTATIDKSKILNDIISSINGTVSRLLGWEIYCTFNYNISAVECELHIFAKDNRDLIKLYVLDPKEVPEDILVESYKDEVKNLLIDVAKLDIFTSGLVGTWSKTDTTYVISSIDGYRITVKTFFRGLRSSLCQDV